MAGIYVHVPFCQTKCLYCDFYSIAPEGLRKPYVEAVCRELADRKDYLQGEPIETIYFGGGTPSQLKAESLGRILETIFSRYEAGQCKEITLEANPDDLTPAYLAQLSELPIDRLSIGVQTLDDGLLRLLNRRHNARQAADAVKDARKAGFGNISIDLIYGLPGQTREMWENDLRLATELGPEHISAYHLTYEENTPLHNALRRGELKEAGEEDSLFFFTRLIERLTEAGYEHYEISNFCRPGRQSAHNSSYWKGVKYLGCGPSAHSYDGVSREWNVSSAGKYIEGINSNKRVFEKEELDETTRYNEKVITSLRTSKGLDLAHIESDYGPARLAYCLKQAQQHIEAGNLLLENGCLRLSPRGIFISDGIMSDLLLVAG